MAEKYPKRVLSTKRRVDHGAGVKKYGITNRIIGMSILPHIVTRIR
jgi:hypothetical protein